MEEERTLNSREEVRKSEKMLAKVLTTLWALPNGVQIKLRHSEKCSNENNDHLILDVVERSGPVTVAEFEVSLRCAMLTLGCIRCEVNKGTSAGIVFRHSQNSEYIPSTQTTESFASVESPNSLAVSSWGNSTILDRLQSSERRLYKNFRDDRTSDESYSPPKAVNREIVMSLEEGKTTDANGVGDSKYAGPSRVPVKDVIRRMRIGNGESTEPVESTLEEDTQVQLPSTVAYSQSGINSLLMEAVEEMERGEEVPAVVEEVRSTLSDQETGL